MSALDASYLSKTQWKGLISILPHRIEKQCQLGQQEFLPLTITNETNGIIAWKLKTNRPGRYMVSPKHGIIQANGKQECTVVVSAMKEAPDPKKSDKFLIQATKVAGNETDSTLVDLWRLRESKHDKKKAIYAYEAITVKCYLTISTGQPSLPTVTETDGISSPNTKTPTPQNDEQEQAQEQEQERHQQQQQQGLTESEIEKEEKSSTLAQAMSKDDISNGEESINRKMNIIENYAAQATAKVEEIEAKASNNNNNNSDNNNGNGNNNSNYSIEEINRWKQQALEYTEMYELTKKLLDQRGKTQTKLRSAEQKIKLADQQIRDLREEIKQLRQRLRNQDLTSNGEENNEKKEENKIQYNHLDEIDKRKANKGFSISLIQVVITLIIAAIAFALGSMDIFGIKRFV